MSTGKEMPKNVKQAGPISVRVIKKGELEIFQTDLGWKYSIPFYGSALELCCHLITLAHWLEKYEREDSGDAHK